MNEQNAQWLENRPMWKVDKANPKLLKHPIRWLASASYRMADRYGWLDMRVIKRANEIVNSQAKRKAKRT